MEGPSGDLIVKKEEPASPSDKEKSGVYLGMGEEFLKSIFLLGDGIPGLGGGRDSTSPHLNTLDRWVWELSLPKSFSFSIFQDFWRKLGHL